tara:strand:+ start:6985 stop:7632 length:648 start_codon:yes stop_codon:yes gene_type:complete
MISHKHKFIFLHIPKCAGTSIGEKLNSHFDELWTYSGFKIHHDDLTEDILKEYFVFTIVRNPWDRLYSQYKFRPWLNCEPFENTVYNLEEKFEAAYNKSVRNIPEHINPKLDTAYNRANWYDEFVHVPSQVEFLNGKYNDNMKKISYIDYIGRFEDLDNSWKYICNKLNIEYSELPHKNKSEYKELDYRKAYTSETKEFVAKKYSEDIKLFNYEF